MRRAHTCQPSGRSATANGRSLLVRTAIHPQLKRTPAPTVGLRIRIRAVCRCGDSHQDRSSRCPWSCHKSTRSSLRSERCDPGTCNARKRHRRRRSLVSGRPRRTHCLPSAAKMGGALRAGWRAWSERPLCSPVTLTWSCWARVTLVSDETSHGPAPASQRP